VKFSSPLHLHKGLSGAYGDILAVVPPRAGECRFVRVVLVLIFPRGTSCVGLVLPSCQPGPGPSSRAALPRSRSPGCNSWPRPSRVFARPGASSQGRALAQRCDYRQRAYFRATECTMIIR
jgi:hypothetical protein